MSATITNTVKNIDGTPVANASVYISFVPGNDNGAFDPATLYEYVTSTIQVSADVNGFWTVDLKSNGDFTLDNTYYKVQEVISVDKINEYDIIVPTGGGIFSLYSVLAAPSPVGVSFSSPYVTLVEVLTLFQTFNESVLTINVTDPTFSLRSYDSYSIYNLTLNAASTAITVAALEVGRSFTISLKQGAASRLVTWDADIVWASGTAPTLTTTINKVDVFTFVCIDGTRYLGFVAGQNF